MHEKCTQHLMVPSACKIYLAFNQSAINYVFSGLRHLTWCMSTQTLIEF